MKNNLYLLLSVCVFFACSTNDPIEVRDDIVSISLLDVDERSNSYNYKENSAAGDDVKQPDGHAFKDQEGRK